MLSVCGTGGGDSQICEVTDRGFLSVKYTLNSTNSYAEKFNNTLRNEIKHIVEARLDAIRRAKDDAKRMGFPYTAWDMSEILTTAMLKDLDPLYNP